MQFPSKFIQASKVTITSKTLTEQVKYGLRSNKAKRGDPHQWSVEWVTRKLTDRDYSELTAFLNGLNGKYGIFTLPNPKPYYSTDMSYQVDGGKTAGSDVIAVKNLTDNVIAGDFINFDNHTKTYQIQLTSEQPVNGETTVTITPRLQVDVPDNAVISKAQFTLSLTSDNMASVFEAAKLHTPILIAAEEVL